MEKRRVRIAGPSAGSMQAPAPSSSGSRRGDRGVVGGPRAVEEQIQGAQIGELWVEVVGEQSEWEGCREVLPAPALVLTLVSLVAAVRCGASG